MKRALCVGINEFANYPDATLRGCYGDAVRMRAFLNVELGVAESEIIYLLDRKAEAQRILDTLQALAELTDDGDYLAVTFSSHGTQVVDVDGDELDGYHEALVCTDLNGNDETWLSGYILDKTFRETLGKANSGARVECWIDTCFAGGIRELATLGMTYSKARMLKNPNAKNLPKRRLGLAPPDNVVIWAACKEAQTSADTLIGNEWCGAFTHYFINQYHPDLTRRAVLKKVSVGLSRGGYSQVPQITCGADSFADLKVGR